MCGEKTTVVKIKEQALSDNDQCATALREQFRQQGTLVVNLISSPGSGKTTLLEETLNGLKGKLSCAVLVGDVATERDAQRLAVTGAPSHQIVTGGACHLDARMVVQGLEQLSPGKLDLLFIENVGNLVCPTSYDLGEDFKIALLSVTEGEDKPFKYPGIFARATLTLVTKTDLLPHLEFDLELVRQQVQTLNPDAETLSCSAKSGEGMEQWLELLLQRAAAKRDQAATAD